MTVKELVSELKKLNKIKNFVVHIDDCTKYGYDGGLVGKWNESNKVHEEVKHIKYVDWAETLHIYLEKCKYYD